MVVESIVSQMPILVVLLQKWYITMHGVHIMHTLKGHQMKKLSMKLMVSFDLVRFVRFLACTNVKYILSLIKYAVYIHVCWQSDYFNIMQSFVSVTYRRIRNNTDISGFKLQGTSMPKHD